MAGASKNSRTTVATQKFICPDCGGEIIMKTMIENGRLKNQAANMMQKKCFIQKLASD